MLEHYLLAVNNYIFSHPHLGLLFAFLVALAESLPILGTIIPGSITMTLIGILVGRDVMPLSLTLLLGTIGALCGDVLGFWVGKYYKHRLHNMWPFRKYPQLLTKGEEFFGKHGGKSIIIGRFIGPTRSSVPLIAGLLKMRWPNFLVAAIPSAFLWALVYLLPGVLLGAISLALPKDKATTFTLIGLGCIIFLWLVFWAIQRFFVFIAQAINRLIDRCWNWFNRHHSAKFLIRLIACKHNPLDHHQLTLTLLALLTFWFFLLIFCNVYFQVGLYKFNEPIFNFLQSLRGQRGDVFFIVMTELGNNLVILITSGLILLTLASQRQWYTFFHVVILLILAGGSVELIKHIYYSPRPSGFMLINKSSSFPSGHVTLSVSLLGFFAFLSSRCINREWRWIPYFLLCLAVFLIALSRVYLGAHWFCDILAGICLGLTLLLLVIISYRRHCVTPTSPRLLLIALVVAIVTPWLVMLAKNFHHDNYQYTPYYPQQTVVRQDWWRFPGAYLPIYRSNRLGAPIQPFNIQWAGTLNDIKNTLQQKGWIEINSKRNLHSTLQRFASKNPEQHLAFLAQLYQHKPPVIFMVKRMPDQQSIIELRLWHTHIDFSENNECLFIGSINYHYSPLSLISLRTSVQISLKQGGGINQLIAAIKNKYQWKKLIIEENTLPKNIHHLQWNREILMIQPK